MDTISPSKNVTVQLLEVILSLRGASVTKQSLKDCFAKNARNDMSVGTLLSIELLPKNRKLNSKLFKQARASTLIELLISISFIGMIVLTVGVIDIATRRFFVGADYQARVQNEASPVMEMMTREISQGIGQKSDPGVIYASGELWVRMDTTDSPGNYNDDTWYAYTYDSGTYQIRRKDCGSGVSRAACASSYSAVAWNISGWTVDVPGAASDNDLLVNVAITARRNAAQSVSSDNPEVALETTVALRSQSIS